MSWLFVLVNVYCFRFRCLTIFSVKIYNVENNLMSNCIFITVYIQKVNRDICLEVKCNGVYLSRNGLETRYDERNQDPISSKGSSITGNDYTESYFYSHNDHSSGTVSRLFLLRRHYGEEDTQKEEVKGVRRWWKQKGSRTDGS